MNQLDPHSDYLDMAELETLEDSTNGQVTGIGVELTTEDGLIKVVTPLDQSPAQEAGIRSGDFITHVDDVFIYDNSFSEVAKRIKGTPGTSVKITISRPKPMRSNIL